MILLPVLNAVAALVSTASAALVLVRPEAMSGSRSVSAGERFFARMYAARAIPFGLVIAVMPFPLFTAACDPMAVRLVLVAATVVQAVDVAIGLSRGRWAMVAGPSVAALIHALTAWFLH